MNRAEFPGDPSTIPARFRFNPEWGLMSLASSEGSRGDWVKCQHKDVVRAIESRVGNLDVSIAENYSEQARSRNLGYGEGSVYQEADIR